MERSLRIGVVVPMAEETDTGATPSWSEIRAVAEAAEAGGLDSIWTFDHLLFRFPDEPTGGIHEAWTVLSALAAVTVRAQLGVLVLCSSFRNPGLTAKMAVTADEVSGGRVILGLGAGWHQPEYTAFGVPFDHLASRFEEALSITVPLLRDGRVDFTGRYLTARDAELRPRGPRVGGPPVLIAGSGPRLLRLVARYADAYNTAWYGRPTERLSAMREALDEACAAEGRDAATLEFTVGVRVGFDSAGSAPVDADSLLTGDDAAIADGLRAFAAAGAAHVICTMPGITPEKVGRLATAALLARGP